LDALESQRPNGIGLFELSIGMVSFNYRVKVAEFTPDLEADG